MLDKNQTVFVSELHREIWIKRINMIPITQSKAYMAENEWIMYKDLHDFLANTYEDMFGNPEKYAVDYNGNKTYANPHSIPQMGTLLHSKKQNRFLGGLMRENGQYIYDTEEWPKGKKTERLNRFVMELEKMGFIAVLQSENIALQNNTYPRMLDAVYHWQNFWKEHMTPSNRYYLQEVVNSADYRVMNPKFKHSFYDFIHTMSDKESAFFTELHDYAIGKGAKLESNKQSYFRYSYKYKNQRVLLVEKQLPCPHVPYGFGEIDSFVSIAKKQPDGDKLVSLKILH